MSARRFPFGRASTCTTTTTLPPSEPRATDPLVGFVPPGHVLPFRATERAASPAPIAPARRRVAARPRSRLARRVAVALVLLALYVAALWLILAPRGP